MIRTEIKKLKPERKALRNFGIVFSVFFLILTAVKYIRHSEFQAVFISLAVIFIIPALLSPRTLYYPYRLWMIFGIVMNYIMTRLILILLFYLIMAPISLLLRIMGKDILGKKIMKESDSYWKDHKTPASKESYARQF